jgi:hypothetical protein
MTTRGDELTPCYCASCPACGGMVAVTVAPVEEPETMRSALKSYREWERAGLTMGTTTVGAIRTGALTGHLEDCPNDKRKRRPLWTEETPCLY